MSPPPGSPLRSRRGTLRFPPPAFPGAVSLPCLFLVFSLRSPSSFPLFLSPFAGCYDCFSLVVPLFLSSRPLLTLVPVSVVSSPLTSWHIYAHPQGPAPKSATCPISPYLPSRHQQALGAPVPLECIQLFLFSALGLSLSPQRRDLSCTPSVGTVGC